MVVKALQREPFNRYQTAQELGAALEELSEPTTRDVVGRRPLAVASRRRPIAIVAVSLLATVIFMAWLLPRARSRSASPAAVAPMLAILPVDNPTDDAQAEHLGSVLESLVAANVRSIDKVHVLPRESTVQFGQRRRELSALKRELAAEYVLDLTVMNVTATPRIVARLSRTDPPSVAWQDTITGEPVRVAQALLDGVARALSGSTGRRAIALSSQDLVRLRHVPFRSDQAVMHYIEAEALLDRSDLSANASKAVDRLQQAVDLDGSFALGYAALGTALLMQYERARDARLIDRATAAVSSALRLDAGLSATQYAAGYLQYVTARREVAIASLQRAIAIDPDNDAAHRLLGWRLFANQARMDEAVAELRHAVRIRPDSFENFYRLGTVLYLAGRYQEAVDAYRRATELQPRRADAYTNLGAAYHMLGDVNQAIGNYEHAVGLGAGDAQAFGNLAVSYFFGGRYEDALRTCLEAIRRDPTRASLQRDLGDYYAKLGRTREARAAYTRAIELARQLLAVNPRDAGAVTTIALCEAHLGARSAAERHVAEALTLSPEDRANQMGAAKAYLVLGNTEAALEHLRMAVERGYPAQLVRDDPELTALKSSPGFDNAVSSGLRARARAGASR